MIDRQVLEFWRLCLSFTEYGRPHSSIYTVPEEVTFTFHLRDMVLKMGDADFGPHKLKYLQNKYPLDNLPEDGCIDRVVTQGASSYLHYRRVDPFRGLIADLVYMKSLGFKKITLVAEPYRIKCHKIRVSAIYPLLSDYFDHPILEHQGLAQQVAKNVRYRMERKFDNHSGTRILNDWFHRLNTEESYQRALRRLENIT